MNLAEATQICDRIQQRRTARLKSIGNGLQQHLKKMTSGAIHRNEFYEKVFIMSRKYVREWPTMQIGYPDTLGYYEKQNFNLNRK